MILISDQIISKLQESITFPNVTVKDFYSISKVSPPMVTVDETPGEAVLFPDGKPKIVRNSYQIEVYCKAQSVEGKPASAISCAKQIAIEVDNILNQSFGLTQVGDASFAPYIQDQTVMRCIIRYRGDIDTRTEYIYR